ncbi:hypothetical protein D3C72_2225680 [compost metagenome]
MLYTLKREETNNVIIDLLIKDKISFPQEIIIGYATCSSSLKGEEVVIKDVVICQECKERMIINDRAKYFLNNNTSE